MLDDLSLHAIRVTEPMTGPDPDHQMAKIGLRWSADSALVMAEPDRLNFYDSSTLLGRRTALLHSIQSDIIPCAINDRDSVADEYREDLTVYLRSAKSEYNSFQACSIRRTKEHPRSTPPWTLPPG